MKQYAKDMTLLQGTPQTAYQRTMSNRHSDLEVTALGVKAHSRKTGKTILIPWSNIVGLELIVEGVEKPTALNIQAPPKNTPYSAKAK